MKEYRTFTEGFWIGIGASMEYGIAGLGLLMFIDRIGLLRWIPEGRAGDYALLASIARMIIGGSVRYVDSASKMAPLVLANAPDFSGAFLFLFRCL